MSTWVYVYSVPVERLRAAPGSKDHRIIEALAQVARFLQQIDGIAAHRDEDEAPPPKCAAAVAQIVNGDAFSTAENDRYVYGYAYLAICAILGEEMKHSWAQIIRAGEWFRHVDEALAKIGVPLKVSYLIYRGPLIGIPEPDCPAVGYWTAEEIGAAGRAFEQNAPSSSEELHGQFGVEVIQAIEDIRSWITTARQDGSWLIGAEY